MIEAPDSAFKDLTRALDLSVLEGLLGCAMYQRDSWLVSKGFVCLAFFLRFLADRYALEAFFCFCLNLFHSLCNKVGSS